MRNNPASILKMAIVSAFVALFASPSSAEVIKVPRDYATIQAAIDAASTGDTVAVSKGVYIESIVINKGITVRSTNPTKSSVVEQTIIDADGECSAVVIEHDDAVLKGFTITGGTTQGSCLGVVKGGGILVRGSPTVSNCVIRDNFSQLGGGIYIEGSPEVSHCVIRDNAAVAGGAFMFAGSGRPEILDCTISGNTATQSGGICDTSTSSSPHFFRCEFINNSSSVSNGGMLLQGTNSSGVTDCIFIGNFASNGNGGAITNASANANIRNCLFIGNSASGHGGAIQVLSNTHLTSCEFLGNSAGLDGGGLNATSPAASVMLIADCNFADNIAGGTGGGIKSGAGNDIRLHGSSVSCNSPDQLSVVTFTNQGGNWNASDCYDCGPAVGGAFGQAIAKIGDVDGDGIDDFAVGAPFNSENGDDAGKVYVYSGAAPGGNARRELWSKRGKAFRDRFGWSIAAGDVNGDGVNDVIVGAPWDDSGANNGGRIFVYDGATGASLWNKKGKIAGNQFGKALASGFDVNKDGRHDILVGAPFDDEGGRNAGAVFVLSGKGPLIKKLVGEAKKDLFGSAVAFVGKVNGDAASDFIVGAPKHDKNSKANAGAAYVYAGKSYKLLYKKFGQQAGDLFGTAVGRAGSTNRNTKPYFIVGAPKYDNFLLINTGRVYAYSSKDGKLVWRERGTVSGALLGSSLADAGPMNCDARHDVLAGAPGTPDTGNDYVKVGAVEVISGKTGFPIAFYRGSNAFDRFGAAVAALGSVYDELDPILLMGAPGDD
ncbi:MAG: FG-GAP-like repeat-containing protein, partial [Planctomycetota bacterium]|nr:FG-GAP-like repeat-containing protein [Planctomycetota bacterium]